jgi:hypothetical protein
MRIMRQKAAFCQKIKTFCFESFAFDRQMDELPNRIAIQRQLILALQGLQRMRHNPDTPLTRRVFQDEFSLNRAPCDT